MLAFVIPVRPAQNASDWLDHCAHYRACLQSLLQQEYGGFHIFSICHDVPPNLPASPLHTVVQAPFAPPNKTVWQSDRDAIRKRLHGLKFVDAHKFTHFMFVDSDDRVSSHLAGYVQENKHRDGWYFSHGYHWRATTARLKRWRHFEQFCGTSIVYPTRLLGRIPTDDSGIEIFRTELQHNRARAALAALGIVLTPLPFPGSVYVYTRKNNLSYRRFYYRFWALKRYLLSSPQPQRYSESQMREFNLPTQLQWPTSVTQ